ncbi:MAG: Uma2 family endonuclease [Armatimonadetes bacterium]|nr:Uma2 family endonuclease [Armatimonadota bacterium]
MATAATQVGPPAPTGPDKPLPRMTYEEFLNWAGEDTLAEWVDGEVIVMSPASRTHQDVADFLTAIIRVYVEAKALGVVLSAPFQMKLERGHEPDVLFVAAEHRERLTPGHLEGPADVVIEVMSTESADRARDRGEKYFEYEEGGVREYWLIDPVRQEAEFYRLDERGIYRTVAHDEEGVFRSAVVEGFWLCVAWLWQDPLPPVLDVLRQLGLL